MKWRTEQRRIDDLMPYEFNPRILTDKQAKDLQASLQKFDVVEIPAINKDNMIIAGHQRLKILQLLGRGGDKIDVRVPDRKLTKKEMQEYNIRSNKNTGDWDWEILANVFDVDDLLNWGFEDTELKLEKDTEEDDVPLVTGKPQSKYGEIYQLGRHRLMCGDATKSEDAERLMMGVKADMCFTDPPYNVDYQGGMNDSGKNKRSGIMNDKMTKTNFHEFMTKVCENIVRHTKGGIYVCMSSSELDTLKTAFESVGGHWQSFVIWVKNNFTLSRADYQHTYEPILYGWPKKIKNHYFIDYRNNPNVWEDLKEVKSEFKQGYTTIKFQGYEVRIKGRAEGEIKRKKQKVDIWRYDKPSRSEEYPTMKPVALCAYAVQNSSPVKGTVLDLFGGSGSTLIASEQTGRTCYMMELDPHYCDIIRKRYAQYKAKEEDQK